MAPFHESDLADKRWDEAEWRDFELWERLELQHKKKKSYWIYATVGVFVLLSAVPTLRDRWDKWHGGAIALELGREWNQIKREAAVLQAPIRIRMEPGSTLNAVIERVQDCRQTEIGQQLRTVNLEVNPDASQPFRLLDPERGRSMGIPGLTRGICYDPLQGVFGDKEKVESLVGIAFLPESDLKDENLDRLTTVLVKGASGDISFD